MKNCTVVFIGGFNTWPPTEKTHVFSRVEQDSRYELFANPGGFMSLEVTEGNATHCFSFARLSFNGSTGTQCMIIRCGSEGPKFDVGGASIPLVNDPMEYPVVRLMAGPAASARLPALSPLSPETPAGVAEEEAFFVRSVQDLEGKSLSDDAYTVLRASGVLRQLLLDGLLHKANARLRQKIHFTTNDYNVAFPSGISAPDEDWKLLSPEHGGTVDTLTIGLDQFLAAPALRLRSTKVSVKDVIQACANALGGVHFGNTRNDREEAVVQFDKVQIAFGSKPSVHALRHICRVTVRALHPLVIAIQETHSA